jgi:hypothetical protein
MPNKGSVTFFKENIQKLYSLGLAEQLALEKSIQNNEKNVKKFLVRRHIITDIEKNNVSESKFDSVQALSDLFSLLCFIQAWSDFAEIWDDMAERQQMKFKKDINKSKRKLIHTGLFKSVYEILFQFKSAAETEEKNKIEVLLNRLIQYAERKKTLIEVIKEFLEYKEFTPTFENTSEANKNVIASEDISQANKNVINESFSAAVKAISGFSLWDDKFLYSCGWGIGLFASLACGLSTGAAIFILLASFSLPLGFIIPLSILIFIAGTRANFQLFSQHIPQFFHDLCTEGGITEFIDHKGKRLQLSKGKKFLLLPLGLLSLSVGITAAAITYLEGTKMIALICPMLAATCPHLTAALLGILAIALLIGLTIIMLRTFIGVLQSQFSWQAIKEDISEKWQKINVKQICFYFFKVLVMAAAFFGLVYLDFTGTATLAGLIGWIAADVITIAAIIGDLPFTLKTALAWCNSLFNKTDSSSNLEKDARYYLGKIVEFLALVINAIGNAALVFTDSWVSRMASIACFGNSYVSNRIQEDEGKLFQSRAKATQNSLGSLYGFFQPACLDIQITSHLKIVQLDPFNTYF